MQYKGAKTLTFLSVLCAFALIKKAMGSINITH